jgi:hypothetical protein
MQALSVTLSLFPKTAYLGYCSILYRLVQGTDRNKPGGELPPPVAPIKAIAKFNHDTDLLVVGIHVMTERFLFKRNPEHRVFTAPFEGVFVITFGAILPGLALLTYGAFAIATVHDLNIAEEIGKLALLLVVPLFNFFCWSAIRKGYLVRPRVTGLMTGFALGLSASWTAIFLRTIFAGHSDSTCKFGRMLLLCTFPFLLFAAVCLSLDLWNKTDATTRRITTTFSILEILLSAVFIFTPMAPFKQSHPHILTLHGSGERGISCRACPSAGF